MTIARRAFMAAGLTGLASLGHSKDYPDRPIRLVVPFPPGGGTDLIARQLASAFGERWGWTVAVENRPGAGGNLALGSVARGSPDGYTFVLAQTDNAVLNTLTYSRLNYDPRADLVCVGTVARGHGALLVVRADSPLKNLEDILAEARRAPGTLSFGTPGLGTLIHVMLELWQQSARVSFNHVPYRGFTQAYPDLQNGRIDLYAGSMPTLIGQLDAGKIKALGITGADRSPMLRAVPTFAESGFPRVVLSTVWGLMAPAGTSEAVVTRFNGALDATLKLPSLRAMIEANGAEILLGSPQDMTALFAGETERLRPIVEAAGVKLD